MSLIQHRLKIAVSSNSTHLFFTEREIVSPSETDYTDVAVAVLTQSDIEQGAWQCIKDTGFELPIFVVNSEDQKLDEKLFIRISGVFEVNSNRQVFYGRQIESAAQKYEEQLLPPFFGSLKKYVEMGNSQFNCPGHQGGEFYRRHPSGKLLVDFFGENIFRADLCVADAKLGDLLIHEGAAHKAQQHAAEVYNADKTYFVLNGTSASNKVVTNALLTPGDLVLFDRNNHKSNHHGALLQAGAIPVYLETARNPFGLIGGIDAHCFDEHYLRERVKKIAPERAHNKRPFRLAAIQLGTYDGTIYNARQVVNKIGHLCDYILFDSAWVGYEQFIPMMKDCSPLLLELTEKDPGILVTQSVHKQQAGFSQTSQIHKKDIHIKGQSRYCNHRRFNNSFMMHASTSPFYPLFASLDVNAKIHNGESGKRLWLDCVRVGVETRKKIFIHAKIIRPFVPPIIKGISWGSYPTSEVIHDLTFFRFEPKQKWHAFEGYEQDQYFVDPCKLLLTTPGIKAETGEYDSFGIPATILTNFLCDNGIIPDKCDLNSILFLLTPAVNMSKMNHLVALILRFEQLVKEDCLLKDVLPSVYQNNEERYQGYSINQLCQEMHNLYVRHNTKELQKQMFREKYFPKVAMNPQQAHHEFLRGNAELVAIEEANGRIAVEGALPYPPGIVCIVPGEVWGGAVQKYFLALEESVNLLPGFPPKLQGVYLKKCVDGKIRVFGYVYKKPAKVIDTGQLS